MSKRRKKPVRVQPAPAIADLMRHGWCRRDAEHIGVVDLALSTVLTIGTEGGRVMAVHAATALLWEPVKCAASALYAEPEHEAAWRALAGYQEPGAMRTFMLGMSAACAGDSVLAGEDAPVTAEDLRLAALAVDAEDRGDFPEALRLLGLSRRPLDDSWMRELDRVVAYGDQMTRAQWGRWICAAALRWCQGTSRGLELGVHYGSTALRALGATEDVITEHAPSRAGYDQLVHDALLFDEGGLNEFFARGLAPLLADKVPGVRAWPTAPVSVVRLVGRSDNGALCEDVLTGACVVVGDALLADQHPAGRLFLGRLVEVEGDERSFFALLPTVLEDECTALELAVAARDGADADERIDLLHRAMASADAA